MLILPLSHESGQVRRLPYVTIGIIILNTLLFLITWYVEPKSRHQFELHSNELFKYYQTHPYLEFSPEVLKKLPPALQAQMKPFKEWGDIPGIENFIRPGAEPEDDSVKLTEQAELNRLSKEFGEAFDNQFYRKYGYIPSEGGFFSIFSSMFLHGGFFHLLFNMFFLYLSGCNIEDLWGRVLYPAFYLIGGIVATLTHGMIHPESTVPLVGASGAIAALMGAFMVRLYNTKIYFFYAIFMGKIKVGTFRASAYVMLPLWLVQQLLEAAKASSSGGGVAFWAHIGGFIFGALVATGVKYLKFEEKYIDPAIEDKINLVNKDFSSGSRKLEEGDLNGAVLDLRKALVRDPGNAIAHSELCRAYCRQGKEKVALLEFQRAMDLYGKREEIDNITDDYIDLCKYYPDTRLEIPLLLEMLSSMKNREMYSQAAAMSQTLLTRLKEEGDKENASKVLEFAMEITVAMENQAMYSQAAAMCQKFLAYLKGEGAKKNDPDVLELTMRYADLCLEHLQRPRDALKSYEIIFEFSGSLPLEDQQDLKSKIQQAAKLAKQKPDAPLPEKKVKKPKENVSAEKGKETESKELKPQPQTKERKEKVSPETNPVKFKPKIQANDLKEKVSAKKEAKPAKSNHQIPMQKRIKLVQDAKVPAKYKVNSVAPYPANKVLPVNGGMNLSRLSEEPLLFHSIYALCVIQFQKDISLVHVDVFISGKSRPYRISSNQIAYSQFLPNCKTNSFQNFRQFVLYLISQTDSVYLDQQTMNFLKTGKPKTFQSQDALELYEKNLWAQLMGEVRFQCEKCYEVYWIDGRRIPETGAKTKCKKCGNPVFVKP